MSLEQGDAAKAEATLSAAAQTETAGRDVYFNLAELKSSKGDAAEAARLYRKAADADPVLGQAALQARPPRDEDRRQRDRRPR